MSTHIVCPYLYTSFIAYACRLSWNDDTAWQTAHREVEDETVTTTSQPCLQVRHLMKKFSGVMPAVLGQPTTTSRSNSNQPEAIPGTLVERRRGRQRPANRLTCCQHGATQHPAVQRPPVRDDAGLQRSVDARTWISCATQLHACTTRLHAGRGWHRSSQELRALCKCFPTSSS